MAQTFPTHAVVGVTLTQAMVTFHVVQVENETVWLYALVAGMLGAIAPDMVMVPEFFWDKYVKKIQPMTQEGPITMFLKEVSHSLFTWLIAGLLWSMFFPAGEMKVFGFVFLICALFAGVVPDIYTHTDPRFLKTDPTFIYPISHITRKRLRYKNPKREYRKAHGDLSMKEWEKSLNFWTSVVFFVLFLVNLI
ncbi:MAG: hypothetical protein UV60_C0002G0023 [Parcubacteria group bacterium GW2011_GWA2_43_11]|nr:MAG: hypothetical protein UV60_C0002G0023 [Parcubacteria group bacterium GW2011_GWA2_43_11]